MARRGCELGRLGSQSQRKSPNGDAPPPPTPLTAAATARPSTLPGAAGRLLRSTEPA